MSRQQGDDGGHASARERILLAAERLFAESGFQGTPTSRIAEAAEVPKGLVHYYFRRKSDLLTALVERLPDERVDPTRVVVRGDIAESLHRLVTELDRRLSASRMLSHLLWREADTHNAVRDALRSRYDVLVGQVKSVILAAAGAGTLALTDVESAAALVALAVSYRHSVARHSDAPDEIRAELTFIASALTGRSGTLRVAPARAP
ncbi:TetR/AcrR family transcriptional regulator [Saccharomonospora piscinae]|uniref:TetR/AcrR family transcriptional regulator n=1 Tax=Saccharomonospora piscinae TaxID=687388 RepID=UPI0004632BFD|nr:TetR/AcrR family transcriptional regulator [Saccharomonospora piscinae]